ncbi:single-stranded DNA-binding protein [Agromyces aerolatus]|uniref:single-stranded DNA-binding protein n=1 Tax=Agromyces sp. LY-1074 TaxID=3074080 RepID=UPI0028583D39|nr:MULTISPECIES: single-stranded DNA-binding protein [unclassified Agromyces]MDR5699891.1 single-stranded DNA-binding protein [Agromyces sp. LY-1074]MDR5706297.1 single-stranded DNA-binding protein [Agromyces sp. LY-1358]
MSTDLITVTGVVGSDPRAIVTGQQLPITSFRLASSRRFYNRATGAWEDAGTNWYTVSAFRQLAFNANASLRKGEHVVVHGRLKQRPWQAGDRAGVAIEIEADAIGHDLSWGMTQLQRLEPPRRDEASTPDPANTSDHNDIDDLDESDELDELDEPDELDDAGDDDDLDEADEEEVSELAGFAS